MEKSQNCKEPTALEESKGDASSRRLDLELIEATKRGDGRAFDTLVKRYERRLFYVAVGIVRNREDAEDAVQQCFMKAFVHLKGFAGQSAFSTWITRIAINEALMILRKFPTRAFVSVDEALGEDGNDSLLEIPDSKADIEQSYAQLERARLLSSAANQLTPKIRRTIELALEEQTAKETAKIMGLSVPAVKARFFHARRKLRPVLRRLLKPACSVERTGGPERRAR